MHHSFLGGGHRFTPLPPSLPPSPQTIFAVAESGFMHHSFSDGGGKMQVDIVNRDGEVLLSKTLQQKRKVGGGGGGGKKGGGVAGGMGGEVGGVMEVKHL